LGVQDLVLLRVLLHSLAVQFQQVFLGLLDEASDLLAEVAVVSLVLELLDAVFQLMVLGP
jgi:hypothetical protein